MLPGITFGKLLGEGTFGAVYQGHHEGLSIDIAIKQIKQLSPVAFSRGLAEARLMARLDHPNLLRIYDVRQQDGSLFLLCELMDGSLEASASLSGDELIALTSQLLAGLQALHQAKIIHRDLKPANFLRRASDGRIKLADLGIAIEEEALTREKHPTGTLPFMAPELFENKPRFGVSSDLYALGVSILCLALPAAPYPSGSWPELIHWIIDNKKPLLQKERPDLPDRFSRLIDQLCHPDPNKRPASATEALAQLTQEKPTQSAPKRTGQMVGPWITGEGIYRSRNWLAYAATHFQSGAPARVCFLQKNGPLAGGEALILSSAERASKLSHPGLLPVMDWGQQDGLAYVVTAPQGKNLQLMIKEEGRLSEVEALRFTQQLAEGLAYLHENGFVYQMVEPGSAQIRFDGRTAQLSWPVFCVPRGSAPKDERGRPLAVYVPLYAAPEALEKSPVEINRDIYGLGQILFFLLAGEPIHNDSSMTQMLLKKADAPDDLPQRLPLITKPTQRLIRDLLQPDPSARPTSARDVCAALQSIIHHLSSF
jgi:serine/threonine protein kinase